MRRWATAALLGVVLCGSELVAQEGEPAVPGEGVPGEDPFVAEGEEPAGAMEVRRVATDEFNPDVEDKAARWVAPARGGTLRVRMPGDPKSLNPICDNDSPTRDVYRYMANGLVERDPETFEWLPTLARWYEVRDTCLLNDDTLHVGRVLEDGAEVVRFGVGAARVTLGEHELARFEPDEGEPIDLTEGVPFDRVGTQVGRVICKDGTGIPPLRGTVARPPNGEFTVWVETTPSEVVEIPRGAIKIVTENEEQGTPERVEALRLEVDYVFHLRRGVTWHDGQPFSAADVVFSFDTIMNTTVDSAELRQFFVNLDVWEATDDFTVHFRYGQQYFGAFGAIVNDAKIYPRHRYQPEQFTGDPEGFGRHFNRHTDHQGPINLGPYRFVRWERGRQLILRRNEDWWATYQDDDGTWRARVPWVNPLQPYLDELRWVFINDKQASIQALVDGEVDADFDIEPASWSAAANNTPAFRRQVVRAQFLQPLYTYIGWNQNRAGVGPERQFFADRRVRQAMSLLVPRQRILHDIHDGLGEIVSGPFFAYGPYADPTVEAVEENLRRAELLLDAAGWIDHDGDGVRDRDGVSFEFEYIIHNMRDYHQKIADIVKESVERAGVRMHIRKLDWSVFVDTVLDQQFDAVRFAWGEPSCIDTDPFQIWHSSQANGRGSNYVSFGTPLTDRLILQARRELDFRERQRLYRQLHRVLHREQPYTFLFNFYSLYFYNRRYRGVRFYIIGEQPYRFEEWYIPRS